MIKNIIFSVFLAVVVPLSAVSNVNAANLPVGNPHKNVCSKQNKLVPSCDSKIVYKKDGTRPLATASYANGYGPADLVSAYKLPALPTGNFVSNGQTVAIVDAYDNPNAA